MTHTRVLGPAFGPDHMRRTFLRRGLPGTRSTAVLILLASATMLGTTIVPFASAAPAPPATSPPSAFPAPLITGNFGSPGNNWTTFMGGIDHSSYQNDSPSLQAS